MDWKTCATDVSPIVQPCRVWQHWENLISASDDCAHAPGKPKRFSLAAHVHATIGAGTNTLEQKARLWHKCERGHLSFIVHLGPAI